MQTWNVCRKTAEPIKHQWTRQFLRKHSTNYRCITFISRNSGCHYEANSCSRYLYSFTYLSHPRLIVGFRVLFCQYTVLMLQYPFVRKQIQELLTVGFLMIGHSGDNVIQIILGLTSCTLQVASRAISPFGRKYWPHSFSSARLSWPYKTYRL